MHTLGFLIGYDGPPPITAGRIFTDWTLSPLLLTGLLVIAAAYMAGVVRLRRRGVRWPWYRTASFLGGLTLIAFVTLGGIGSYDDTLFWDHMLQHMVLSMVAPVFLALGAPVTLALRALPRRGARRLQRVLHSRVARTIAHPAISGPLLVATPFALYFTSLYQLSLEHAWLHDLIHAHFVFAGCLFFIPLLGLDPVPGRLPHLARLIISFLILPSHAFLGVAVMQASQPLAGSYYRALGRSWGPSLLGDQNIGGGILWASGDIVGLLFIAVLYVQWFRAEDRASRREDRRLDREERLATAALVEASAVVEEEALRVGAPPPAVPRRIRTIRPHP